VEESTREEISAQLKTVRVEMETGDQDFVEPKQKWVEPTLIAYNSSDKQKGASSTSAAF
jgi:hypothetical protein